MGSQIRKDGVVTNGGELHVLGLQTVDTFKSLVDVRSGEVNFAEVKQLLDTSDKGSFLPTAVAFHPSLTMLGKHPSLLVRHDLLLCALSLAGVTVRGGRWARKAGRSRR